jgi:hypothetical protein
MLFPKSRMGVLTGLIGGLRIKTMRRMLVLPWPFALIPPLFTTNYSRDTSGIGYSIALKKRRRNKRKGLLYGIGRPGVILQRLAIATAPLAISRYMSRIGICTLPSVGAMGFLESAQEEANRFTRVPTERSNDLQGGQQRDGELESSSQMCRSSTQDKEALRRHLGPRRHWTQALPGPPLQTA